VRGQVDKAGGNELDKAQHGHQHTRDAARHGTAERNCDGFQDDDDVDYTHPAVLLLLKLNDTADSK